MLNTEQLTDRDLGDDDYFSENCLPVGMRLAEFEITGVIGEGGFGIVYMTFDHSLRRPVAVKEYMPASIALRGADHGVVVRAKRHQPTFDTGLRSFINEARLLAQFDHPALIKVHRFWEQHGTAYMAMRYYEGSTLKEILQHDPAGVNEAWLRPMLESILQALETLYAENILHRDISPDNILIQENGDAVLLDFGSARQVINNLSQSLTVILKPGYAPIEQYADDSTMTQGPWTDIYALSAVMYLAITQQPPPTSVARMVTDTIEPLANAPRPGFCTFFLAAIDQGLNIRPEQRPQTIDAFRRLLPVDVPARTNEMALTAVGTSSPSVAALRHRRSATGTTNESARIPRAAVVTIAIGLLILSVSIVIWLLRAH